MSELGSGYPPQDWSVSDERDARIADLEAENAELRRERDEWAWMFGELLHHGSRYKNKHHRAGYSDLFALVTQDIREAAPSPDAKEATE